MSPEEKQVPESFKSYEEDTLSVNELDRFEQTLVTIVENAVVPGTDYQGLRSAQTANSLSAMTRMATFTGWSIRAGNKDKGTGEPALATEGAASEAVWPALLGQILTSRQAAEACLCAVGCRAVAEGDAEAMMMT